MARLTAPESLDDMPAGIQVVARYFYECARRYFPELNSLPFVGAFVLLRFVNPAVTSPELYGLLGPSSSSAPSAVKQRTLSPTVYRNLVLVAKVMQNISNGVMFNTKEAYMTKVNAYVERNIPRLWGFLSEVINSNVSSAQNLVRDSDLCDIESESTKFHMLHVWLCQCKADIVKHFASEADQKEFDEKLTQLGSYNLKESFAFALDATEQKHVKDVLAQRNLEASFISWLTAPSSKKGSKSSTVGEKQILVVARNRVLLFKKGGAKLLKEGHTLDLKEITSHSPTELKLVFADNVEISGTTEQADEIIHCISRAFAYTFKGVPKELRFLVDVTPALRYEDVASPEMPNGGFLSAYRALCDYYGTPSNSELCWDIEHLNQNRRDFDLKHFFSATTGEESVVLDDLIPVFRALTFNCYYSSFSLRETKIDKSFGVLTDLLRYNTTLTSVLLANIGLNERGFASLFDAMANNDECAITSIDVSDNPCFDEKVVAALAGYLSRSHVGVCVLRMRNTFPSVKPLAMFAGALASATKTRGSSTLTQLDISQNKLRDDAASQLAQWLGGSGNALSELDLGYSSLHGANLAQVADAMKCCLSLMRLHMPGLKLSKVDEATHLAQMLASSHIAELDLTEASITPPVFTELLNFKREEPIGFNFSGTPLGLQGAQILHVAVPNLTCLTSLDLSNTELGDDGIIAVVERVFLVCTLVRLNIGGCFGKTSRPRTDVVRALVKLLHSDCPLETLLLAGGIKTTQQLGKALVPFLHGLAENETVTELDVSGHMFGNVGAVAFAKVLQVNTTLTNISWDDNDTGLAGLAAMCTALKVNPIKRYLMSPVNDIAALNGKEDKKRLHQVTGELQQLCGNC
eukprot:TRINITY_DN1984_c0_g1_i2.p1 TRINITY_DN1984_c0_g1~~TRINITY_DN1984_c0_g1_i2.p1  ORF type:complete len:863 (+),score=245.36 TRINITY_DN1984_c0_g1_i2:1382-3970(+)